MLTLVFRGKCLMLLVGWEYLGFISFILIMYYKKMSRLRASVITLFSSRLGDVALFVLFRRLWLCRGASG